MRHAVRFRLAWIGGFAVVMALGAVAQARNFEMGGDNQFPYSIMAPEPGTATHHRATRSHRPAPDTTAPDATPLNSARDGRQAAGDARHLRLGAADAAAAHPAHSARGQRHANDAGLAAAARPDFRAERAEPRRDPQSAARLRDIPGPRLALHVPAGPLRRAGDRRQPVYGRLRAVIFAIISPRPPPARGGFSYGLTGNQMVAYCRHGCGVQGFGRREPSGTA